MLDKRLKKSSVHRSPTGWIFYLPILVHHLEFSCAERVETLLLLRALRYTQPMSYVINSAGYHGRIFYSGGIIDIVLPEQRRPFSPLNSCLFAYVVCRPHGDDFHRSNVTSQRISFIEALAVTSIKLSNIQRPRFLTDFDEPTKLQKINTVFPSLYIGSKNPDQFTEFLPPKPIWWKTANSHSKGQSIRRLCSFLLTGMPYSAKKTQTQQGPDARLAHRRDPLRAVGASQLKPTDWKTFATIWGTPRLTIGSFECMTNGDGTRFPILTDRIKIRKHSLGLDMLIQACIVGALLIGAVHLWLLIPAYRTTHSKDCLRVARHALPV